MEWVSESQSKSLTKKLSVPFAWIALPWPSVLSFRFQLKGYFYWETFPRDPLKVHFTLILYVVLIFGIGLIMALIVSVVDSLFAISQLGRELHEDRDRSVLLAMASTVPGTMPGPYGKSRGSKYSFS